MGNRTNLDVLAGSANLCKGGGGSFRIAAANGEAIKLK